MFHEKLFLFLDLANFFSQFCINQGCHDAHSMPIASEIRPLHSNYIYSSVLASPKSVLTDGE